MRKRSYLLCAILIAFIGMIRTAKAQDGIMNPITPVGWLHSPLLTPMQYMQMRGPVKQIIQKRKIKSDYVMMNPADTFKFDSNGRILSICSPKKDPYSPQVKFNPTTYIYKYSNGRCEGFKLEEWSENASSKRPLMKRIFTTYEYDQQGRLWKGWEKIYFEEPDGRIREALEEFTKDPKFVLTYANGKLSSVDFNLTEQGKYNDQGLLVQQKAKDRPDAKPIEYTYDQQGRITGMKRFYVDVMDDLDGDKENFLDATTVTYNAKGDIIKISTTSSLCNNKWAVVRKLNTEAKTYTYTYDTKGNWTKVTIKETNNAQSIDRGFIERQITYWDISKETGTTDTKVYDIVDEMPMFPGGQAALMKYLSENIRYPKEANGVKGRVMVRFVINKEGKVTDCIVLKSVSPELDNEALRVIKSMPTWIPGKREGKPVNVKYTIPINFTP